MNQPEGLLATKVAMLVITAGAGLAFIGVVAGSGVILLTGVTVALFGGICVLVCRKVRDL